MRRFFSARIAFFEQLEREGKRGESAEFMQIARSYTLWWDSKVPQQSDLWGSSVKLDREFFEAIIASPVPVDVRALKALKRSPLALDLYALCCYEAYRVERSGKARFIAWSLLLQQLGSDYVGDDAIKNFSKEARAALNKIQAVMPSLRLGKQAGGLSIISGSTPAIPAKL